MERFKATASPEALAAVKDGIRAAQAVDKARRLGSFRLLAFRALTV